MNLLMGSGSLDAGYLFASILWGALGSGIFLFGWKQKSPLPLAGGGILVGITYFVESALLMSAIGVAVLAGMYWVKKRGF